MFRLFCCVLSLFVIAPGVFAQQPSTVLVFNDSPDLTDQFSKSYIWQELGLLGTQWKTRDDST
jgi:hypothetical protein